MVKESQQKDTYHAGIDKLLRAAYLRDFSMLEMGRCKRKFPTFQDWYNTLKPDQRLRVDVLLEKIYGHKHRAP